MAEFPAGAPNFQLPSPYRGVVYFTEGRLFCMVGGSVVFSHLLAHPEHIPAVAVPVNPINQRDEE